MAEPAIRKGSDPKSRQAYYEQIKAKAALSEKYKALWSGLNDFIHRNGGWLVSLPSEQWLRMEARQDSELPDKLYDLGYDLQPAGSNTRIEGGQFVPVACYTFTIPLGK